MKLKAFILYTGSLLSFLNLASAQTDTLRENFIDICDQFEIPYREYTVEYTGPNGITWDVQTYYMPTAGGIEDDGGIVQSSNHCGSLYWTSGKSGYAKAVLDSGITELTFQVLSGGFQKDGFVKVLVDGQLVGQTDPIKGYQVETYTFFINTPGTLVLELVHGIKEGSTYGGILVDNLVWTPKEGSRPFFRVETLDDYHSGMDTLRSFLDTMEIIIDTRGCVTLNGEYYDYLGMVETADIVLGSVLELNPKDSCNIYYWGYASPSSEPTGEDLSVRVSVPVNRISDTIMFNSTEGGDMKEGILSFINGNVAIDLVVFKINKLQHEYRIRYAYDFYEQETTDLEKRSYEPDIEFFPNPVQNFAFFRTGKRLKSFDVMDMGGRILHSVKDPAETAEGYYRLDLENLETGVWIVRFLYQDQHMDALKIIVE